MDLQTLGSGIILTSFAGALLSVILEYVPYASTWYEKRSSEAKKQLMGAMLVLSAIIIFALGCYSPFITTACTAAGGWEMVAMLGSSLLAGVVSNQGVHMLTKK